MSHRSDRVYLDPAETRCEPSRYCPEKGRCARWLAALPPGAAKLEDFSLGVAPGAMCAQWAAVVKPVAPAAEARRFPPVRGVG